MLLKMVGCLLLGFYTGTKRTPPFFFGGTLFCTSWFPAIFFAFSFALAVKFPFHPLEVSLFWGIRKRTAQCTLKSFVFLFGPSTASGFTRADRILSEGRCGVQLRGGCGAVRGHSGAPRGADFRAPIRGVELNELDELGMSRKVAIANLEFFALASVGATSPKVCDISIIIIYIFLGGPFSSLGISQPGFYTVCAVQWLGVRVFHSLKKSRLEQGISLDRPDLNFTSTPDEADLG